MKRIVALSLFLLAGCSQTQVAVTPTAVPPVKAPPRVVNVKPVPTPTFMPVSSTGLPTMPGQRVTAPQIAVERVATGEIRAERIVRRSQPLGAAPVGKLKAVRIAHWVGEGMKNTENFTVTSPRAFLSWASSPIEDNIPGLAQAFAYKGSGEMADLGINQVIRSSQSGTTHFKIPGEYYLKINCANVTYSISVWDYR